MTCRQLVSAKETEEAGSIMIVVLAVVTVVAVGVLALASLAFTNQRAANAFADKERLVNALDVGLAVAVENVRGGAAEPVCAPSAPPTPTPTPASTSGPTATPAPTPSAAPAIPPTAPARSYGPIDVRITCIGTGPYTFEVTRIPDCTSESPPGALEIRNVDGLGGRASAPVPPATPTPGPGPAVAGPSTVLRAVVAVEGGSARTTSRSVGTRPCATPTPTPTPTPS